MTTPKLDSIDELINGLLYSTEYPIKNKHLKDCLFVWQDEGICLSEARIPKAKQALSTLVAGIIGEDEVHYSHVCPKDSTDCAMFRQRMRTRREQRLRAKEAGIGL